jgi:hypothetical protein
MAGTTNFCGTFKSPNAALYNVKADTTAFHSAASELGSLDENRVVGVEEDFGRNGRDDLILLEYVMADGIAAYFARENNGV